MEEQKLWEGSQSAGLCWNDGCSFPPWFSPCCYTLLFPPSLPTSACSGWPHFRACRSLSKGGEPATSCLLMPSVLLPMLCYPDGGSCSWRSEGFQSFQTLLECLWEEAWGLPHAWHLTSPSPLLISSQLARLHEPDDWVLLEQKGCCWDFESRYCPELGKGVLGHESKRSPSCPLIFPEPCM